MVTKISQDVLHLLPPWTTSVVKKKLYRISFVKISGVESCTSSGFSGFCQQASNIFRK